MEHTTGYQQKTGTMRYIQALARRPACRLAKGREVDEQETHRHLFCDRREGLGVDRAQQGESDSAKKGATTN